MIYIYIYLCIMNSYAIIDDFCLTCWRILKSRLQCHEDKWLHGIPCPVYTVCVILANNILLYINIYFSLSTIITV